MEISESTECNSIPSESETLASEENCEDVIEFCASPMCISPVVQQQRSKSVPRAVTTEREVTTELPRSPLHSPVKKKVSSKLLQLTRFSYKPYESHIAKFKKFKLTNFTAKVYLEEDVQFTLQIDTQKTSTSEFVIPCTDPPEVRLSRQYSTFKSVSFPGDSGN